MRSQKDKKVVAVTKNSDHKNSDSYAFSAKLLMIGSLVEKV